jgi:hypothetical protein
VQVPLEGDADADASDEGAVTTCCSWWNVDWSSYSIEKQRNIDGDRGRKRDIDREYTRSWGRLIS